MAVITPSTDLILLKVPLEMDEVNQLTFANKTAQYNYFNSLPKLAVDDFTYQRKDGTVRFGANFDDVISYNYCMYRNDAYSDKWFYAYVENVEYLNDSVTAVKIKSDVWQTWCFDLVYKPVFVEREHVNDDTFGLHTYPEGLETGEYVKNKITGTPSPLKNSTMMYAVGVSEVIGTLSPMPTSYINNIPQGLFYVLTDSAGILHSIVDMYDHAGKSSAIYTMFIFPKNVLYVRQGESGTYDYSAATWEYSDGSGYTASISADLYVPTTSTLVGSLATNITVPVPSVIGQSYEPKNNKLKTFPYCFFNVSNNAGTTVTYHYEDFTGTPTFNIDSVFSVGCSTKMYPINYKNMNITTGDLVDNPYDYGVNGGKYPTISWNSDSFTNWITQNAINMNANVLGSITSSALGGFKIGGLTGAAVSGSISAISSITQNIATTMQASRMPDQTYGNTNSGDINFSKNKNCFTIFEMSIKPEYARIIDNYFSMFGYKVNQVKVPNITGRRNWNYVKTINCYLDGDIPQADMEEIKQLFNNGVTFWHNPSTFADYSQNNDII